MDREEEPFFLTEDVVLYILYLLAKRRRSQVFFKVSHNVSVDRPWHFWCAPDMDLIEVQSDGAIVAYEVKGQRKRKDGHEWPPIHTGLDQALAYLTLPKVTDHTTASRIFEGGVADLVYLVHPLPTGYSPDPGDLKVIALTAVGFVGVWPRSPMPSPDGVEPDIKRMLTEQFSKVIELVPAKTNPLQDPQAKEFFLKNLAFLEQFGEGSRTFRGRVERAGMKYLGLSTAHRPVVDAVASKV